MTLEINVQRQAFLLYNQIQNNKYHISGFRREAGEHCALLGDYATSSGHFLQTLQDKVWVPSSGSRIQKNLVS
jgi:hypothetical protein